MQKKIKIVLVVIAAIILCVPAQAQDYLSIEEAIDIILDYHNIETDITGIADYLTLDAKNEDMTREISPLKPADDAIIIDNSGDDPDEMVEYLRNIVESCR